MASGWLRSQATIRTPTAPFSGRSAPSSACYTCTADCWWYVRYDLSALGAGFQPTDRSTWTARGLGNPVTLVPYAP
ncbi:MAG: hypothetical protein OEW91_09695 [Acidimicrobiia bacterium]|nr:hypothetical protein [Acidimicrobiia bacterium]